MRLQVKGKNVDVSDAIRAYAEEKLAKLDRQLDDPRVELELALEKNPSIAASQIAEATVFTKGPVLRAREASEDMKASIDQLVDKLERQVTRYREKRKRGRGGRAGQNGGAGAGSGGPRGGGAGVVEKKQVAGETMEP